MRVITRRREEAAAAESQPRFSHRCATFGARAFGRRRVGVWAKAVTGGDQSGSVAKTQKARRRHLPEAGLEGRGGQILLGKPVVCGANYYAESAAVSIDAPPKHAVGALHNYRAFPTSLNIAISLSGTLNLPRLRVGGIPMARASSFSVGSARR
jgi:hypothetical protein